MKNINKLDSLQLQGLLEILLEKSFEAVIITDASVDDHRILYANPRFCKMTGYSKEELYGQSPRILGGEKTNPEVIKRLKASLVSGEHFIGATTNYRKDGTSYPVQWNIYPVNDNEGQAQFFVSIQKDLSDLRRSLTRLKSSSGYFRQFLMELEQKRLLDKSEGSTAAQDKVESELKSNVQMLSDYVNTSDATSNDEEDFFDFDDFAIDSDIDSVGADMEKLSAVELFTSTSIDESVLRDLISIAASLKKYAEEYDLQDLFESDRKELIEELQELANAIFFIEEFMDISVSLSELVVGMYHRVEEPFDVIIAESLKGLINDLYIWIQEVFETRTSSNIHWLDNSIIGSCKQVLVFVRLQEIE
ncbi:PAS domain-containing protein [Aestuariibacter salexigens]|uniref:PAS domain-containing protein n=1 Tax=Aestuariibacter salexigens TaxID=226010 RepID=UPI000408DF49|nr:PAS domain S-box protein [Aestuariibacter salexigens]